MSDNRQSVAGPVSPEKNVPGPAAPAVLCPVSRVMPLYPNVSANSELVVLEPTNGRAPAGVRSTAVIQLIEMAARTAPAAKSCHSRRRQGIGAPKRYATLNAGSTRYASSVLMLNPTPTSAAAS